MWQEVANIRLTLRLTIYACAEVTGSLLWDLSRLSFPYLKCVNIQSNRNLDGEFSTAENTPALEQLVLKYYRLPIMILPSLERLMTLRGDMRAAVFILLVYPVQVPFAQDLQLFLGVEFLVCKYVIILVAEMRCPANSREHLRRARVTLDDDKALRSSSLLDYARASSTGSESA
ncbi:hypothetical protein EDC04DRAFT_853917 [Pisolithus marmoratus]|nr:hypothetical protein EDC04DRAFT_853917 [Pisolithus marmoratus]